VKDWIKHCIVSTSIAAAYIVFMLLGRKEHNEKQDKEKENLLTKTIRGLVVSALSTRIKLWVPINLCIKQLGENQPYFRSLTKIGEVLC
jgi:hypothetical protein